MRLAGIYSNHLIVSGYGYNLLIYPVSDADIRIRISAEGVIRNQIRRIGAYPYPTTAQKPYPDSPWSPPFLGLPLDYPPHTSITASRNHRTASWPFLVGWHQAELTSCSQPRRAQYYARVRPWWSSVEVPYGAMVELPPVQEYMSGALSDREDFSFRVLRSERAVLAGAYLVNSFRTRGIMWLHPKSLHSWILRVGLQAICHGPTGPDERAAEELGALFALL